MYVVQQQLHLVVPVSVITLYRPLAVTAAGTRAGCHCRRHTRRTRQIGVALFVAWLLLTRHVVI